MGNEAAHVTIAILILFVVCAVGFVIEGDHLMVSKVFVFSVVVVLGSVLVKKGMARLLDARAEHKIWEVYQFWWRPHFHFPKPQMFGIYVPIFFSFFSMGAWKVMTLLTYETRALKRRAARRLGYYSFTEMTDWHHGLIGAAGIVFLLLVTFVSYLPGFEYLTKMAAGYAFWNMIPISKLDGTQIFVGSRILWTILAVLTVIFGFYAMVI